MSKISQKSIYPEFQKLLEIGGCSECEQEFAKIFQNFLQGFQKDESKRIITNFHQRFPQNMYLIKLQANLEPQNSGWLSKSINLASKVVSIIKTNQKSKFDIIREYNEARESKNYLQLLNLIENDLFFVSIDFPSPLHDMKEILQDLQENSLRVFEIIEYCQKGTLSMDLNFLSELLYFLFNAPKMNNEDHQQLLCFLGQITSNLICQFQNLLLVIKESDKENHFKQFISDIQQVQVGKIENSNLDKYRKNLNYYDLISKIALLKVNHNVDNWKIMMAQVFNKTEFDESLSNEIQECIMFNISTNYQTQQIYFLSLFTLWIISAQSDLVKYEYLKSYHQEDWVKNAINQAIQAESYQLTKFLLGKIFYFSDSFSEIDQQLEYLRSQEFNSQQQFQNLELVSPPGIFQFSNFCKIRLFASNISPYNIVKTLKEQQLMIKLIQICSMLNIQNIKQNISFIYENISKQKVNDICHYLILVQQNKNYCSQKELCLQFQIFSEYFGFNFNDFKLLLQFISKDCALEQLQKYLAFCHVLKNKNSSVLVEEVKDYNRDTWNFIKQFVNLETLVNFVNLIGSTYLNNPQNSSETSLKILQQILPLPKLQGKFQLLETFLQQKEANNVHQIMLLNNQQQLSFEEYQITVNFLFDVIQQNDFQTKKPLFQYLNELFFTHSFYEINFIWDQTSKKANQDDILSTLDIAYFIKIDDRKNYMLMSQQFYQRTPQSYSDLLQYFDFFGKQQLMPIQLDRRIKYDLYPRGLKITLEEFNISLALMNEEQQYNLVNNWVKNMKDNVSFKNLIPFFFNILKRGESVKNFLSLVNQSIRKNQIFKQSGFFNLKSLFQILYNNSNPELQVMLLKLQSKVQPIPLIYRTPFKEEGESEILSFNSNAFYVFQESYTIINFSLGEKQNRIGKTELINKIFYQVDKFEICDNCEINKQTIDIMFDFSFSGSRNLTIADVHDFIPLDILDKVLPLFRLWIIQVDTESEIEETIFSLKKLQSFQQFKKRKIFLFIRNSKPDQLTDDLIKKLEENQITYQQIEDLTDKELNKQMIESEIQTAAKKLYRFISQHYSNEIVTQQDFLNLINNNSASKKFITEFQQNAEIIQQLNQELNRLMTLEEGFYSKDAFPLRNLDFKIKQLRNEYQKASSNQQDDKQYEKLLQLNEQIKNLEKQIPLQQPTRILELFCQIFEKTNHYILYLWFVDKIRCFNEHHTYKLQDENQKINEQIQKLKKEKEQLKQKEQQNGSLEQNQKDRIQEINRITQQHKEQLEKNLDIIALRNIGIELFWREIIQQQQKCQEFKLRIEPAEIVHGMIAKGEPFEFLDGDQLRIDQKFLQTLIEQFQNKGSERILVLSVLGPQSSGKSTILNKIFGCHFWTSVGRCTKGIYLQILKIHNKNYFDNLFDYILILDTEGLQNPNQEDHEFDKKIALFVLAISDIILINVKGDIHQQFKNLVEMCIFTLGQMRNFSSVKQISWCFNQNNDVSNFAPFLHQLQGIASNLNVQYSQNEQEGMIDYHDILGISKSNIQILGFASTEQTWRKSESTGVYADWRQQMLNETFSEEAYLYGVRIIKYYSDKFKQQQDGELQNLKYFIQIIENNWQSIQRLPDLLEFSELIQHQQNLLMKQEFDVIIKSKNIAITNDILRDIHEKILSKGAQVNLLFLQELQTDKDREAFNTLDQVQKEFVQKLLQIKNQHKISKKIYLKYENMTKERIKSQYLECQLSIHNEIKNHETEFQKKRGFFQLDTYVSGLNHKPDELKRLKEDEKLIKSKFNELWSNIIQQQTRSQEEMFLEFVKKLFGIISQEFSNYILKSRNENVYQTHFINSLIKQPLSQGDFQDIFSLFKLELSQQQFMVIEKSQKNYQYTEIFYKKIELKLNSVQDADMFRMTQFYRFKITVFFTTQNNVKEYLKFGMIQDLQNFVDNKKRSHKQGDLKNQINSFFSYLYFFGIQHAQNEVDVLIDALLAPGPLFGIFSSDCQREYEDFLSKLQFFRPPQKNSLSVFEAVKNYFKGLRYFSHDFECQQISNDMNEQVIRELSKKEEIILLYQQQMVMTNPQLSNKMKDIFDYIKDPNDKGYKYNEFKSQITLTCTELMQRNNNQGWQKLYSQIYQMVIDETLRNQNLNQASNLADQHDVDITQYNVSLIKIIMAKIEIMIKNFNKQFSNYGIILNDLGERCIYYFSIFIIWRLLCYGQWKLMSINIQKLQAQTEEQFQKFKADIQQNKREQSILRGNTLATEIYNLSIDKFYIENTKVATDILKQYQNETSFSLVKKLDKLILEKQDATITDDQIMDYIRNHSNYVERVVIKNISGIVTQIQEKLQQLLRNEIKQHLVRIQRNTRNLKNFSVDPIKAQDYFMEFENKDQKVSYENLLYKIVLSCLQGVQPKDADFIKKEYQGAFDITGYVKIEVPLITSVQSSFDSEIQILMHFIQAFDDKISEMLKNCDNLPLNLSKLNVQTLLDEIKFIQIGCLQTCPICKRKCDQDPKDNSHKHSCQNGHQLRGMNGVLINNNPSLFTCEEISDEFQIEEQETKSIKRWKDIKAAYSNWQFSCLSNDDLKKHKEKFMNIWNNKIGQMICKQLEKDLGVVVYYIPKHEIDPTNQIAQRKVHYILIMDDSGSMSGRKWENVKAGAVSFLWEIAKNRLSKVTVIIFNSNARCVIDFEDLQPSNQEKKIVFNSGGTDFDFAFLLAFEKITRNPQFNQFDSHQMYFYTDGYASYPTRAINSFKSLTREQKQRIQLVACTEEGQSPILEQIVANLSAEIARAELRKSVQPQQMGQVWVEIIQKRYHKLEC